MEDEREQVVSSPAAPCAQVLALIKQLYGIERLADRHLDAPARHPLFARPEL